MKGGDRPAIGAEPAGLVVPLDRGGNTSPMLEAHADSWDDQPATATCGDVRAEFCRRNLRCTKQRVEVYQALAACRCHPTAEQLHRMLSEGSPGTSLATVYNTLEVLCEAGVCRRIPTTAGARYDADLNPHLHLVTTDGRLVDVPADLGDELLAELPERLRERVEARLGVTIARIEVQLFAKSEPIDPPIG